MIACSLLCPVNVPGTATPGVAPAPAEVSAAGDGGSSAFVAKLLKQLNQGGQRIISEVRRDVQSSVSDPEEVKRLFAETQKGVR